MKYLQHMKAHTILDALTHFDVRVRKGGDSGRMENSIACLSSQNLDTPFSFTTLYYRLRCMDLARFRNVDGLLAEMSMSTGMLADMDDENVRNDIDAFVRDVLGHVFVAFLNVCKQQGTKEKWQAFASLIGG